MARKLGESEGGYRPAAAGRSTDTGRDATSIISETPRGVYTRPQPPPPKRVIEQAPITTAAAPENEFRNEQLRMIQALQIAAMGDQNSRAQQQMRDIYRQQRGQISSGISGARGVAAGAAQEMIQRNQAAADQSYNLDSRMLMSQEQRAAQQALLTELGYMRDQDINKSQEDAGFTQQSRLLANQYLADELGRKFKNWDDLNLLSQEWARMQHGLDAKLSKAAIEETGRLGQAGSSAAAAGGKMNSGGGYKQYNPQAGQKLTDLMGDK